MRHMETVFLLLVPLTFHISPLWSPGFLSRHECMGLGDRERLQEVVIFALLGEKVEVNVSQVLLDSSERRSQDISADPREEEMTHPALPPHIIMRTRAPSGPRSD